MSARNGGEDSHTKGEGCFIHLLFLCSQGPHIVQEPDHRLVEPIGEMIAQRLADRFGLSGQTALVTGGTKGLGEAIIADLAGLGAKVCGRS